MAGNTFVEKIRQWPVDVKSYVQELKREMHMVTWPSRKQVESTTAVVIFTVFGFAAYFFVVDSIFSRAIGKLFDAFAKH